MVYLTKEKLYKYVEYVRNHYNYQNKPIDTILLAKSLKTIDLEFADFKTKGLCGIAFKGEKCDTIILNNNRNSREQKFDCGHELMHLFKHRNENNGYFQCFENHNSQQNFYIEWQANEGSAEMLLPYKMFLPVLAEIIDSLKCTYLSSCKYNSLTSLLSNKFDVSKSMIWCRLESLKYEFYQYYKQGKNINSLCIISKNELDKQNLKIPSINDVVDKQTDLFIKDSAYAKKCLNLNHII